MVKKKDDKDTPADDPKPDDKDAKKVDDQGDPKPDDDQKSVSLDEHVKLRKAKNDRIAELEAEVNKLKESRQPPKKDDDTKPDSDADVAKRLKKLETDATNRALAEQLGISETAAGKVADFMAKNPTVEAEEALVLLKGRGGDEFESVDPVVHHGQLRPGSRGKGEKSEPEVTWEDRLEHGRKLAKTDKRAAKAYFANQCGHFLAQAMGWDHHRTPIPKEKKR